jgi:hypothetical protein
MDVHIVYEHTILPDYGNNFIVYVKREVQRFLIARYLGPDLHNLLHYH